MKTIWHNAVFYTMEKEGQCAEALLTENGKIIAAGTFSELANDAGNAIDLKGAFVYPGFIDNHMHIIGQGEKLLRLDLSKAASADEMMQLLHNKPHSGKEDDWFVGEGWNENNFPDQRIPSLQELDAVTDSPMLLKRTCWHAALVNSKTLELAGITKDTPNPADGVIERNADGEPTGLLKEGAMHRVMELMPEPTEEYVVQALKTAIDHLLSVGLTGAVTDDLGYYGPYTVPLSAFNETLSGKRKFRAHLLRHFSVFEQLAEGGAAYNEPFVEAGAMKFFIDGAFGGSTALLSEPYSDDPENFGTAVLTDEQLEQLLQLARRHGEAVAVHVIGDAALEKALNVLEKYPAPAGKKDRLIHVLALHSGLIERMKQLPVVLDIQPAFVPSDFPWVQERLGEERLKQAYAWKTLIDEGLICGGGSDAPIEDPNPLYGIHAAIARRKPSEQHSGYLPDERLSRFEAVQLFTSGAAATISKEHMRGKLAAGFDADFTVLSGDLFTVPVDEILEIQVKQTVVAGEVMYEADN